MRIWAITLCMCRNKCFSVRINLNFEPLFSKNITTLNSHHTLDGLWFNKKTFGIEANARFFSIFLSHKLVKRFCRKRDFCVLCVNVLLTIWKISFPFRKLNFPDIFILWKLHIYTKNWTNMLTIYQNRYKIFFKI